jgi:hypothetical protein
MRLIEATVSASDMPPPKDGMVRVYHSQTHIVPDVLTNREVETYNSMGTWFNSSPEIGRLLYGNNVTAYDIPASSYLEPSDDFLTATLGHNLPLIREHLGVAAADHLTRYPWNDEQWERWAEIDTMFRDEKVPFRDVSRLMREREALTRSRDIVRDACLHPGYCRDFRAMIEAAGYRGFLWRNSHIDGEGPHDVYLLFHTDDIHPVGKGGQATGL